MAEIVTGMLLRKRVSDTGEVLSFDLGPEDDTMVLCVAPSDAAEWEKFDGRMVKVTFSVEEEK